MSKDLLGQIISKLRGAHYLAKQGRMAEALADQRAAEYLVRGHCALAIPPISLRDMALSLLGQQAGNLYIVEYEHLNHQIDQILYRKDEHIMSVNDPLEGLTSAKLLRLFIEQVLKENDLAYGDISGVTAYWEGESLDLDFDIAITKRVNIEAA